jgi:hypothetical protein
MQTALVNNEVIPAPAEGISSDTSTYVNCTDEKHAAFLFEKASRRLLDVNNWGNYTSKLCAGFALTDSRGDLVEDEAKEGYRIRINIPGPGTKAGKGYDWVRIEKIELSNGKDSGEEYIAMKVRPASNPKKIAGRTAHFFKSHATSTFMVKREGLQISCNVAGRNEKPNTNQKTFLDSLRNILVAILSFFGFSKLQWKCLTKGILSYSNKEKEMVR